LFLFARLTSDHMFVYLSQEEPFTSAMSYSRLPSQNRHGKRFFRFLIF